MKWRKSDAQLIKLPVVRQSVFLSQHITQHSAVGEISKLCATLLLITRSSENAIVVDFHFLIFKSHLKALESFINFSSTNVIIEEVF